MNVRFSPEAEVDLLSTVEHIARANPRAADALSKRVLAVIEHLAAGDFDGPESRISSGESVHSWPVPPLRIYYKRQADTFFVVRVYHHAREPISR